MNHVQMWLFLTNQSEPLRQSSLLMLLAGGIGHGDSLISALRAHESECSGVWASQVGQLRMLMEQGHSLSSALSVVSHLLPDQTVSSIRMAERTGTLPDVLMDEAQRLSRNASAPRSVGLNLETLIVWIPCVLLVMSALTSFLVIFIVPKMKAVFVGFGIELPGITKAAVDVSDFLTMYGALFFLPCAAIVGCLVYFGLGSQKRRLVRGYHRFAEYWPRYWMPGLLRQMSLAATTDLPLSLAVDCAMQDLPPGRASRKISELRHRVQGGEEAIGVMRQLRLLRQSEAAFLQSANSSRHLAWGFRHLAESIERRRGTWLRRIPEIGGPLLIVAIGLLVLFIVLAFFLPLLALIEEQAR